MKKLILFGCLLVLAAGLVTSQNHVNGYAGISTSGNVYFLDGANKLTTVKVGTSTEYGMVMDRTNSLLIAFDGPGNLVQVDPVTQTVVGTLAGPFSSPYDMAVDQNGDYFIVSSTTLWKLDSASTITTVLTGLASASGGMDIDIDSGDLLVQSRTGVDPLWRITRDGSSITTVASGGDPRYGITQHIPTGDIFTGSCCGDFSPPENVFQYPAGTSIATVWLSSASPPVGVYSLKADRSSAANQRLILGGFGASASRGDGGFFTIDIASKLVNRLTTLTVSFYETEILYRRNVHSYATGKGTWNIGITIPEDPGKPYILAVSASGVRPGIPFPDGRLACLNLDTITYVGLTTGLAPYVTNTSGTLSALGRATAKLDLSSLGPVANGVLLFFDVITLDPAAPLGIKTITDPHVIKVEGL